MEDNNNNGTQYYQQPQEAPPEAPVNNAPPQTQYQYNDQNAYNPNVYTGQNIYTDEIPDGVKGWNWGAFMYGWIWGVGNSAYLTFLTFIPLIGFIFNFVNGVKGNEWAWKSGKFKDVETFRAVQRTWNRAGLVAFIVAIVGAVLMLALWGTLVAMLIRMGREGALGAYDGGYNF